MECRFCDFVNGKAKKHKDQYPFMPLHETKNTLSFLSIDFPATTDGHILVIPKKHYQSIEEVPKKTLHELIEHISLITKILKTYNEGNNILLNNGKSAGQSIFHTHFHIIPRNKKDKITIEIWKRKKLTKNEFKKLHNKIKKQIKKEFMHKNKGHN